MAADATEVIETKDRNGRTVWVGMRVRLVVPLPSFVAKLPTDEQKDVCEMLAEILEVDEIDEHAQAWVSKKWDTGPGECRIHSVALSPSEFEVVDT